MSKQKKDSLLKDTQACAKGMRMRISPQKLNLVAQVMRGKSVAHALRDLAFCSKRVAVDVRKILLSAIANAENNHGLNVDQLRVVEASVGRSLVLKRADFKGRSRMGRIRKPFSHLYVVVEEEARC